MPRENAAAGSSIGAASGCICRVEVVIHMSMCNCRQEALHNRAAQQQQQVRSMALQRAQQFRPARLPPEQARQAAADATLARLDLRANNLSVQHQHQHQMRT